jgi:hypothetical protein
VEASANMAKAVANLFPSYVQNVLAYRVLKFPDFGVPEVNRRR